ncbi:hypothetical protein [Actinokineospora sp. HUAS TT18]|uniref:hypothetical protein n=1 Tax=Actinokineospora sp. HUAS TT18 TaxID=3447451 RepID=UPI003F51FD08
MSLTVGAKSPPVMAAVDAGTRAGRAARGMGKFRAMRDGWADLRDRLDADLGVRARAMATAGIGGLLGTPRSSTSGRRSAVAAQAAATSQPRSAAVTALTSR